MFATVIFCVFIHVTLTLPSSQFVKNNQLPSVATSNNFYANQNAYANNGNFREFKENLRIASRQNVYPPLNYNVNPQGPIRQDLINQPQRPLLEGPFDLPKPAMQQFLNVPLAPVVQTSNKILINNRRPEVPYNIPTISEPKPNTQTFINRENIVMPSPIREPNTVPRKKAYTIIHPNGAIEESDNLEDIIKIYPNYVLINANEAKKNPVPVRNINPVTINPEKVHAKNPLANPTLVPLFNKPISNTTPSLPLETLYTNTSKAVKTDAIPPLVTNKFITKAVDDIKKGYKNTSNLAEIGEQTGHPLPKFEGKLTKAEDKIKEIANNTPALETHAQNKITAANEIISKINQTNLIYNHHEVTVDSLEVNKSVNNTTEIKDKIDSSAKENRTDLHPLSQNEPTKNELHEKLKVNETSEAIRKLNNPMPETLVSPDKDKIKVDNEFNLNTDVEYNKDKDDSIPSTECIVQEKDDDEKIYIPNISFLKDNDTDTPFWFNAADQSVWEMLLNKNNSSAVFFFVPSAVLERNTSVTIYPNGTKVEETVVVRNEGDKPIVTRTTIINHAADEEKNDT